MPAGGESMAKPMLETNRRGRRSFGHGPMSLAPKIGVMGGAMDISDREQMSKAHELGEIIAGSGCVLITGACPGLPLAAACGAKQAGGLVIGISPAGNLKEHIESYRSPVAFHDVLIFTGSGMMGREVTNIRSSDMVAILGGRSGTLGEFAIAYDEGKPIGVLTGMGGVGEIAAEIVDACGKSTGAKVIYESEPRRLVAGLLKIHVKSPYGDMRGVDAPTQGEGKTPVARELDVVCRMRILPQAAVAKRTWKGRRFVFCSKTCAERFSADPGAFVPRRGRRAARRNSG